MRMNKRISPLQRSGFAEHAAPGIAHERRKSTAQQIYERDNPAKRAVNLTASSYYLHEAKQLKLNLSEIFARALEAAVTDAIREEIRRDIAAFAQWQQKDLEQNGLWSDGLRTF
ncbi:MAG: type II toxin-antitoxin system CcdA family antitoxin [Micropepsaceae bacterium]